MNYPLLLQSFDYQDISISYYIPDEEILRNKYLLAKENEKTIIFPYWGKIWSASLALSRFCIANKDLFEGKYIVELAAGLGLPSLVLSHFSQRVCCTDYVQEALDVVNKSIVYNQLPNVTTMQLDWRDIADDFMADCVLISDLNYEPIYFDALYDTVVGLLNKGIVIVLATPQRLMAKDFILRILPFVSQQEEKSVTDFYGVQEWISVYVLKK